MSDENNTGNLQALSVLDLDNIETLLVAYNDLALLLPSSNHAARILYFLNQSFESHLQELKKAAGLVDVSQM